MPQLLVPVHVGSDPPESWDTIEIRRRMAGEYASAWVRDRPTIADPGIDWAAIGIDPRWIGFDTADCVAALAPSTLANRGSGEFARFRQGASSRRETAIVISPLTDRPSLSDLIGAFYESTITGRPLGLGAKVRRAANLGGADRQLALRLLSSNVTLHWQRLSLAGAVYEGVQQRVAYPPQGTLVPIVETELGEPVVAVWVSPDEMERRYVLPAESPWPLLLSWLIEQALPEFVPGAIRRSRRLLSTDDTLRTRRERDARQALTDLDAEHGARRAVLEKELAAAEAAASSLREALLYGSSKQLVNAVSAVLAMAGVSVTNVDTMLRGTKNADLLCTYDGRSLLVEVKSATGSASEVAYQDLIRHLREWPHLPGAIPVEGGALVINHQTRTVPEERSPRPYPRPEFLDAQTEPIVTTLDLVNAWRDENWSVVRHLLFGFPAKEADAGPRT